MPRTHRLTPKIAPVAPRSMPANTVGKNAVSKQSGKSKSGDLFVSAPAAGRTDRSSLRDPAKAAAFVRDFDGRLGLAGNVLKARDAHMTESALAFFQANPALFHSDLSRAGLSDLGEGTPPQIPIDGDSHLANFGAFRGADGHSRFGINDFDQGGLGSPERDLARLAASTVLAARQAGLGKPEQTELVRELGKAYFAQIHDAAAHRGTPATLDAGSASGPVKDLLAKSEGNKRKELLGKLVDAPDATSPRFKLGAELVAVSPADAKAITAGLADYGRARSKDAKAQLPLQVLDLVKKEGSGGSSFGLPRYYALVKGQEGKLPVVLEVKLCLPSPLDGKPVDLSRSSAASVLKSQQALGGLQNPLTGEARIGGKSFLVRELEPEKERLTPEKQSPKDLLSLSRQAAMALARSHCQGGRADALDAWAGGKSKGAVERLTSFATGYADQAEADYAFFKASLR